MVQALFVDSDGVYPGLLGHSNCWSVERDARFYSECEPVVAHPPCNLWVNMAAVNWKRYGRILPAWYEGGSDGGMFKSAFDNVVSHGGVLEHPASTHAWQYFKIPFPYSKGWRWVGKGWVCQVCQAVYGHRARKLTWLFYSGERPPFDLNWSRKEGTHQIGRFDRVKPYLSNREASATPVEFARLLVALARFSSNSL